MLFILGILDLLAGISIFLLKFGWLTKFGIVMAFYLILKGLVFIRSISSVLDIICGIVMLLLVVGFNVPFYWLFSLWLIQKGFFSLFS